MDQKESFSTMKPEEECSYSKQQSNLWTIGDSCMEEVISSASSSSPEELANTSALLDMSSLLQQLPKRGLYKTRSFLSIFDAKCIEDLVLPEDPYLSYKKSLKARKLIARSSETHKSSPYNICSEKVSRGSHSSLSAKMMGGFLGNKPPIPSPKSPSTNS